MNIPDDTSESLEKIFGLKILKFFYADPDPGSGIFFTLDPGSVRIRDLFGSGINILDPQYCSTVRKCPFLDVSVIFSFNFGFVFFCSKPLTFVRDKSLKKEAIAVFKLVQIYMSDRYV
jgi:hypothetical protein